MMAYAEACPPTHLHRHQISTHLPSAKSSSDQQAAVRGGRVMAAGRVAAALLWDTWQELQLWSVFCKESLAAENAAVSCRFTAQSLQPNPHRILPPEREETETSPCTVSFFTHPIITLFISFFNELTLTSTDSVSGVWASSSLSPQWPPPMWQTCA